MTAIRVGLDSSVASSEPEVTYVLRTLLASAGFPHRVEWIHPGSPQPVIDIYYGPSRPSTRALVEIEPAGVDFQEVSSRRPRAVALSREVPWLDFTGQDPGYETTGASLRIPSDILLACFWMLTGAAEPDLPRDRRDNLQLDESVFLTHQLGAAPIVSLYAELIGKHLERQGHRRLSRPWVGQQGQAAFAMSHDVDYPEMVFWVEALRMMARRGVGGVKTIARVVADKKRFWRFSDWVDFEQSLGARSAFYFMARPGSLMRYALGTPDAFYDIRSARFRDLFSYLRDQGCEIGLHASYNAYRNVTELLAEKERLETAAETAVDGNRHHYWHLNPDAPHETLRLHEQVGLAYDSSLGFEMSSGYRRGICHPFRPFHPGERRALGTVQLPPAWMDDHFDRRLAHTGITDPVAHANALVRVATETGGVVVVDYHVRGMNEDFYPRYGPWLRTFLERHLDSSVCFRTPGEIAKTYLDYEQTLSEQAAADRPLEVGT